MKESIHLLKNQHDKSRAECIAFDRALIGRFRNINVAHFPLFVYNSMRG